MTLTVLSNGDTFIARNQKREIALLDITKAVDVFMEELHRSVGPAPRILTDLRTTEIRIASDQCN